MLARDQHAPRHFRVAQYAEQSSDQARRDRLYLDYKKLLRKSLEHLAQRRDANAAAAEGELFAVGGEIKARVRHAHLRASHLFDPAGLPGNSQQIFVVDYDDLAVARH